MKDKSLKQTAELIVRDFELEPVSEEELGEEELIALLVPRIEWLLEYRTEFLFSLMYRLDVSEAKVNEALSPGAPETAPLGLSRLVIERQKERMATRRAYPARDLAEDWE